MNINKLQAKLSNSHMELCKISKKNDFLHFFCNTLAIKSNISISFQNKNKILVNNYFRNKKNPYK